MLSGNQVMKWSEIMVTHSRSMYLPKIGRETVAIRKYISLAAGIEKRKKDFLKLQESPTYAAQANSVLRRHEGLCKKYTQKHHLCQKVIVSPLLFRISEQQTEPPCRSTHITTTPGSTCTSMYYMYMYYMCKYLHMALVGVNEGSKGSQST